MWPFIKEPQPKELGQSLFFPLKRKKKKYFYIPFFYKVDKTEASLKLFLMLMLALKLSRMQIFIFLILDPSLKYEKIVFCNSETSR